MRVFNPDNYLDCTVTAVQAKQAADISDHQLCKASFVLYGRYVDGKYIDLSSDQKPGDTVAVLGYMGKTLSRGKKNEKG